MHNVRLSGLTALCMGVQTGTVGLAEQRQLR